MILLQFTQKYLLDVFKDESQYLYQGRHHRQKRGGDLLIKVVGQFDSLACLWWRPWNFQNND